MLPERANPLHQKAGREEAGDLGVIQRGQHFDDIHPDNPQSRQGAHDTERLPRREPARRRRPVAGANAGSTASMSNVTYVGSWPMLDRTRSMMAETPWSATTSISWMFTACARVSSSLCPMRMPI